VPISLRRKVFEALADSSLTTQIRKAPRKAEGVSWVTHRKDGPAGQEVHNRSLGSFFQPVPMAAFWVRFFTSTEREKFTPIHPKNYEFFPLPATIRPPPSPSLHPIFPFSPRAERSYFFSRFLLPSLGSFFQPPNALRLGFVFSNPPPRQSKLALAANPLDSFFHFAQWLRSVASKRKMAPRQIRSEKCAFSSPLSAVDS
jgi:hypothetical protein